MSDKIQTPESRWCHPELVNSILAGETEKVAGLLPTNGAPRWNAFRALADFVHSSDSCHLDEAIRQFDLALGDEGKNLVEHQMDVHRRFKNHGWYETRLKANEKKETGKDLLLKPEWSPGTFIVSDFLELKQIHGSEPGTPAPSGQQPVLVSECTPIVYAGTRVFEPGVVELVIERIPGPKGLVTPDFLALGLIALDGEGDRNFLVSMQETIRYTLHSYPTDSNSRFRWRIRKHRAGRLPGSLKDRSAEAAAACCTYALLQNSKDPLRPLVRPLLDAEVVITGTIDRTQHTPEFDLTSVGPVDPLTIPDKLRAASDARLACVLIKSDQEYDKEEASKPVKAGANIKHTSILVQGVDNLAQAYDSLLITSKAVAAYKKQVCGEWAKLWDPQPTPDAYKNASKAEADE
jgi:hypothetical protein